MTQPGIVVFVGAKTEIHVDIKAIQTAPVFQLAVELYCLCDYTKLYNHWKNSVYAAALTIGNIDTY